MNTRALRYISIAGLGVALCSGAAMGKSGPPQPVSKVRAASIMVVKTPHALRICATGTVPTTGWTKPSLDPVVYIHPPVDGIYDVTFNATPPSGISGQMMSQVRALKMWPNPPKGLKGVRVKGANNSVVAKIGGLPATCLTGRKRG